VNKLLEEFEVLRLRFRDRSLIDALDKFGLLGNPKLVKQIVKELHREKRRQQKKLDLINNPCYIPNNPRTVEQEQAYQRLLDIEYCIKVLSLGDKERS